MHILLAAIGKFRSGPEALLWEHYRRRCTWKITCKEWECKKPPPERQALEAQWLLEACEGAGHVVALHERGRELSSAEFAALLGRQRDGARKVAFVIGGADGLHESVTARADLLLSFGRVTWPHLLVRGLLAEQLYRAQTILSGHPYHRE